MRDVQRRAAACMDTSRITCLYMCKLARVLLAASEITKLQIPDWRQLQATTLLARSLYAVAVRASGALRCEQQVSGPGKNNSSKRPLFLPPPPPSGARACVARPPQKLSATHAIAHHAARERTRPADPRTRASSKGTPASHPSLPPPPAPAPAPSSEEEESAQRVKGRRPVNTRVETDFFPTSTDRTD